jgi:hypothetical protein
MQADERICLEPMSADVVATIDEATRTWSAWSIRASVNAIPMAPAPTTR